MALDINDLAMLKGMDSKDGMTPYEQFEQARQQAKKPSGVAIAGLTVASVGTVAAIGAWIFGPLYGSAKAGQAKETAQSAKELANAQYQAALQLMNSQNANTNATLDRVVRALERETDARVAQGLTVTQTINDTISGQQSAAQSAQVSQTSAVDNVVTQSMYQAWNDAISGKSSPNPTPVMIYSAPQPCACPGCGCNG